MLGRMFTRWGTLHRPTVPGCLWMTVLLGALTWLGLRGGGIFLVPPFAATLHDPGLSGQCLDRSTLRHRVRLGPWRGDRHRPPPVPRLRSWRGDGGSAHRHDRATFAAGLYIRRHRFCDVSCSVASRAMARSSGRTAIHARRGDFFRSYEPVAEQLAAIPRATSKRDRLNLSRKLCRARSRCHFPRG